MHISVIAVHDLDGDCVETWTHARSGANWLRDFLPKSVPTARVLTYAYKASASSFFGPEGPAYIQRTAETFVQELYADRRLNGMLSRPIVFVCHGLGGVLVKKALAYASSRVASKVHHLLDIFVSTFAVMFFGTPHDRALVSNWGTARLTGKNKNGNFNNRGASPSTDSEGDTHCFSSVNAEFAPHVNAFHFFFFWEEIPTSFEGRKSFVVDPSAAVMTIDNTEKAGIHASHSDMVKFASMESASYRPVIEALSRYCENSEKIISYRWKQSKLRLNQQRASEAHELGDILTFNVHSDSNPYTHKMEDRPSAPKHFYLPDEAIEDFVGRENVLYSIFDKFFPDDQPLDRQKRKTLTIFGMGGSGKTQLCSKYAQDFQDRYTSVFTIRATSSKTVESSLQNIAILGGLYPTEDAGRHILNHQEGPWLLIIDNADNPSLDLDALFPQNLSAHILITTRNSKLRNKSSLGSIELEGLTKVEALRLLLTKSEITEPWNAETEELANTITESLGYLALAVSQAGTCISQQVCTLESYLSLHSASRNSLRRRKQAITHTTPDPQDEDDMVGIVYSTFDISFESLQRNETIRCRDAIELLKLSAFYHFENIPEEIFTRAICNKRKIYQERPSSPMFSWLSYFKLSEPPKRLPQLLMESGDDLNESRVTWALDRLQSMSLVRRNAKARSFSMHPLVQQWARDKLVGGEKPLWVSISMNTILESIILHLDDSSSSKNDSDPHLDGNFHQSLLPHLSACLQEHGNPISTSTASASRFSVLFSMLFHPNYPQAVRTEIINAGKCAVIFGERGQFQRAAIYLSKVKDTLTNLQGQYSERTMLVTLYLSNLYWGLGRLEESIELLNDVVKARTYVNGPEHEQTLVAMSSLGRAYWLHGCFVQSLSILEYTTGKMCAVLGPDHPQTLTALDNYGMTLGSWYRFRENREIHKRVLRCRQQSLGFEHPETLSTQMNLAMALLGLGQVEQAEKHLQNVYQKRQQQLGKEHPWTLWALCYLAKVYIEKKSLYEAETLLIWGIEAGIRSLGKDHLGVLMGQGYLGLAYARQGKLEDAEAITLKTLAGLRSLRGVAHPDTIFCQWKLAMLYERQSRVVDAIEQCEQAVQNAELRITKEHPMAQQILELLEKLRSVQTPSVVLPGQHHETNVNRSIEVRRRAQHQVSW